MPHILSSFLQAIGNHEFDFGVPALKDFINNVSDSINVLSANIDKMYEPTLNFKPYVVKIVGTRKVGIVGYTTVDTPILTAPGKAKYILSSHARN